MRIIMFLLLFVALTATSQAGQIETVTTENGMKSRWSIISVNNKGVMRIDEGGWSAAASSSAAAAAGTGDVSVNYEKGRVMDTMIFDPQLGEILSVEGKECRVLSKNSAPPPGMGFMNSPEMAQHQQQMAQAMANADKQIAEAMKQMQQSGASQDQIDAMNQMLGGLTQASQPPQPDALIVELAERGVSVGEFRTDAYVAKTVAGAPKFRFYMADIGDVPGGRAAKDGVIGMMNIFAEYLQGFNAGQLMQEAMVKVMNDEQFEDSYPVAIEDLERNTRTEISSASDSPPNVDFSPDCVKKDMMAF